MTKIEQNQEQISQKETRKEAAISWLNAVTEYAAKRASEYAELDGRIVENRPGSVPSGFRGTQLDRETMRAEGSHVDVYYGEPHPDYDGRVHDDFDRAVEYFGLLAKRMEEGELGTWRYWRLETERQDFRDEHGVDPIGIQLSTLEKVSGTDYEQKLEGLTR